MFFPGKARALDCSRDVSNTVDKRETFNAGDGHVHEIQCECECGCSHWEVGVTCNCAIHREMGECRADSLPQGQKGS